MSQIGGELLAAGSQCCEGEHTAPGAAVSLVAHPEVSSPLKCDVPLGDGDVVAEGVGRTQVGPHRHVVTCGSTAVSLFRVNNFGLIPVGAQVQSDALHDKGVRPVPPQFSTER